MKTISALKNKLAPRAFLCYIKIAQILSLDVIIFIIMGISKKGFFLNKITFL